MTADERASFLDAADDAAREVRTFCHVLHYTGCRLSEALNLTADRVDMEARQIVFESLKKRKKGIFRAVPVPPSLIDMLDMVHDIRKAQKARGQGKETLLWSWGRTTAWRKVKAVIAEASIKAGPHANPIGLRHGFAVHAINKDVALNMVQKWMGHADISTTAIYADAIGEEEQNIASRMWD